VTIEISRNIGAGLRAVYTRHALVFFHDHDRYRVGTL
jgi:hypothetical protein